jgi:hypothetical protein
VKLSPFKNNHVRLLPFHLSQSPCDVQLTANALVTKRPVMGFRDSEFKMRRTRAYLAGLDMNQNSILSILVELFQYIGNF